jgi:hypothetical protein
MALLMIDKHNYKYNQPLLSVNSLTIDSQVASSGAICTSTSPQPGGTEAVSHAKIHFTRYIHSAKANI